MCAGGLALCESVIKQGHSKTCLQRSSQGSCWVPKVIKHLPPGASVLGMAAQRLRCLSMSFQELASQQCWPGNRADCGLVSSNGRTNCSLGRLMQATS